MRYTEIHRHSLWSLYHLCLIPEVRFTGGIFRRMKAVASNSNDITGAPTPQHMARQGPVGGTHLQHVVALVVETMSIMSKMNLLHHRLFFLVKK